MIKGERMFILNEPIVPRISPALACEIGLNESIVLLQLEFYISISDNWRDGLKWTFQSVRDLQEKAFPYWSVSTIQRTLKVLLDKQYLIESNYNEHQYDKTRWFTLGPGLNNLQSITIQGGVGTRSGQIGTGGGQIGTRSGQIGTTIPDSTTDSTTDSTDLVGQGDPPVQPPEDKMPSPPYKQIVDLYHQICVSLPKLRELNPSRTQAIRNRWNKNPDIKHFLELFKRVEKSDFLTGKTERPWLGCNFDWIMKLQNFNKILEGNYDNDRRKKPPPQYSSPAHRPFEPEDDA